MDNLTSIKDDTLNMIKTRTKDPIIGSYVLAFVLYNWKIFLILFSKYDVEEKITKIQNYLYQSPPYIYDLFGSYSQSTGFILKIITFIPPSFTIPVLITFFYLIVFPIVTRKIYRFIYSLRVDQTNTLFEEERKVITTKSIIEKIESESNDLRKKREALEELVETLKESNNLHQKNYDEIKEKLIEAEKIGKQHQENYLDAVKELKMAQKPQHISYKMLSPEEEDRFVEFSKSILAQLVRVNGTASEIYRDIIPTLVVNELIEKVEKGNISYWGVTNKGKDYYSQITKKKN